MGWIIDLLQGGIPVTVLVPGPKGQSSDGADG